MKPIYTFDWTTPVIKNFLIIKKKLKKINNVLEIGSYEGRSSAWFLKNFISSTGKLTCIEPFLKLDTKYFINDSFKEKLPIELERKNTFLNSIIISKKKSQQFRLLEYKSYVGLSKLIEEQIYFDFIYIDGNHRTEAVITDAVMSFGILRPGGIILFDDYLLDPKINWFYQNDNYSPNNSVKLAVDSFLKIFNNQIEMLSLENNYQLAIIKK